MTTRKYTWGNRSLKELETCHPLLQKLANRALELGIMDMTVICGHRGKESQDEAYRSGASKLKWPRSKHNSSPSLAMDIVPYPLDWKDIEAFKKLGTLIKGAWESIPEDERKGWELEWGGDWRMRDYPHFQISEVKK